MFKKNIKMTQPLLERLHIDIMMLSLITLLTLIGLAILYSASTHDSTLVGKQLARIALAFVCMFMLAQVPPRYFKQLANILYGIGLFLLVVVMIMGDIGKGAQRWLDFGIIRFQPSELMKLALPLVLAKYLTDKNMPPSLKETGKALILIGLPAILVAKQPDLGTAILIAGSGFAVLFLSGFSWRWIAISTSIVACLMPIFWFFLRDYQKQRVLTFIAPEKDPLGAGYHIIQSKIAIGSGGVYGKGWFNGTQSHLQFLPERSTDFIFAVFSEEFGLIGGLILLLIFFAIIARGMIISIQAQDSFGRLLTGSLTLIFLFYVFINIGMVSGLLPVVGIPLPLISYGGTSMVTLLAGFGIIMSVHTHRNLLAS